MMMTAATFKAFAGPQSHLILRRKSFNYLHFLNEETEGSWNTWQDIQDEV